MSWADSGVTELPYACGIGFWDSQASSQPTALPAGEGWSVPVSRSHEEQKLQEGEEGIMGPDVCPASSVHRPKGLHWPLRACLSVPGTPQLP